MTADAPSNGASTAEPAPDRPSTAGEAGSSAPAGERSPVALRILVAARTCVLDRGISRVTMSDVARGADVSRTTLYRHYPDADAVLRDLMTVEFGAIVSDARGTAAPRATGRERLVETVVHGCRRTRDNPLFRKIVDVDPEFLLPYVTARSGQAQQLVGGLLAAGIRAGQDDGSIRAGDPERLARWLLLQVQALTVSIGTVSAGDAATEDALLTLAGEAFDAQLCPTA
ncbi:MAG: TetR/AcrR family transcriptional regulator [Patulibacter sp.]|nr:TetR/AcrR family transcriptional regulator [Patulibacter sp.]